ncbi:NOP protein chaperone 1 [Lepisosteus oculatus]|uniref:NOP protein chaperone 1 n=1 Tax=Lepisosteus oculatus TaxID=7918 RepID=UPI0037177502
MGDSEQADGRPDKPISHELLSCGRGGALQDKLLLKPRSSKSGGTLQTVKVPRSNVLDRLQCFLPQMAQANEKLRQQMESSPANLFDIENIEESSDKVIEMDVALVELSDSGSEPEEDSSDEEGSESESEGETEITEDTLRLPGSQRKRKANIEVLDSADT